MTTPDKNINRNPHNSPHMTIAYLSTIPSLADFYNDMINTHTKNRNLVSALKASLAYHLERDANALTYFKGPDGDPYAEHAFQAAVHIAEEGVKLKADETSTTPIRMIYRYDHANIVHRTCRTTGDAIRINTLIEAAQNNDDPYWQQVNACAVREAHQAFIDEFQSWRQDTDYPGLITEPSKSSKPAHPHALREVIELFREINLLAATSDKTIGTQRRQTLPIQYSPVATPPDDESEEKVRTIIDTLIFSNNPMVSAVIEVYKPDDPTRQVNHVFVIVAYEHDGMIYCHTPRELYPPTMTNREIQEHHDHMMNFYYELRSSTPGPHRDSELFRKACEDIKSNLHGRRDVLQAGIIR